MVGAQGERGSASSRTALILSGGGARAAYQVGVLAAIREILPARTRNPFPIICGTSAGAINAAALAAGAKNFNRAVGNLIDVWANIHAGDVYRADPLSIARRGAHWLSMFMFGWIVKRAPRSLLDNSPLAGLLAGKIDFSGIAASLSSGDLYALSITASGYTSGESVSFYQGAADVESWRRTQRVGSRAVIGVEHLLASSALPFIFPAVKLHREWFGDGSMRQLAPISPAIHLGAEKILVVGAGRLQEERRQHGADYPSLAQVAGHALSSIFLDGLKMDIERLERVNRTLGLISDEVRGREELALRPIEVLTISPSQRLDHLAVRHARHLPPAVRAMLGGIGAMQRRGGALTSYLLFESAYTTALVELGREDTLARADEVRGFFGMNASCHSG